MSVRFEGGLTKIGQKITNGFLVRFFDIDGTILKEEIVPPGKDATPPTTPYREHLVFYEWNNDYTNITEDMDCGAIYDTDDTSTYVYISLTPPSGLTHYVNLTKSNTSEIIVDFGDGSAPVSSTTSGDAAIYHTYDNYGDYVIKISTQTQGSYYLGGWYGHRYYVIPTAINSVRRVYIGSSSSNYTGYSLFRFHNSLEFISFHPNMTVAYLIFQESNIRHVNLPTGCNLPQNFVAVNYACKRVIPNINRSGYGGLMMYSAEGLIELPKQSAPIFDISSCSLLEKVVTRTTVTSIQAATSCDNLRYVEFQENITSISNSAFNGCYSLMTVIIKTIIPPTAGTTIFPNMNPLCKVYVPDESVNDYKVATNWVDYANYIYPLSEYKP